MMKNMVRLFLLLFFSHILYGTEASSNFDGERYRKIGAMLRCPNCKGVSVLESDSIFSHNIRREIRRRLKKNQTNEQIVTFFTSSYGEWILRSPTPKGMNALFWWLPIVFSIAGVGILLHFRAKNPFIDDKELPNYSSQSIVNQMAAELKGRKARQ